MLRTFVSALVCVLLAAGTLLAEEVRCEVLKADAAKGILTVKFPLAPGSPRRPNRDFTISPDTKIVDLKDNEIKEGLKGKFFHKPGGRLTISVEEKDGKEVVKQIKAWIDPGKADG
jgi:hypothetical protein